MPSQAAVPIKAEMATSSFQERANERVYYPTVSGIDIIYTSDPDEPHRKWRHIRDHPEWLVVDVYGTVSTTPSGDHAAWAFLFSPESTFYGADKCPTGLSQTADAAHLRAVNEILKAIAKDENRRTTGLERLIIRTCSDFVMERMARTEFGEDAERRMVRQPWWQETEFVVRSCYDMMLELRKKGVDVKIWEGTRGQMNAVAALAKNVLARVDEH